MRSTRAPAHPVEELRRDADRALLPVAVARYRYQTISNIAHDGGRASRMHRAQMHRECVSQPLQLGGVEGIGGQGLVGQGGQHGQREDDHRLVGKAQAAQRLPGADAAFQGGGQQVGAQPPLHVGPGPDAEHMQRNEFAGVT